MRRKKTIIREIVPDPKYNSIIAAKFINNIMRKGKKSLAQKIFYQALDLVIERTQKEPPPKGATSKEPSSRAGGPSGPSPIEVLEQAIENASPLLEVKSRRVGGANYQVPYEVRGKRKEALAMRWIIEATRKKKGRPMAEKLAQELIDAFNNTGDAIKKKNEMHRIAEANRAFAHFAW